MNYPAAKLPNVRHDLDPQRVRENVNKKIVHYEVLRIRLKEEAVRLAADYAASPERIKMQWTRVPRGPDYVDPMIDRWIAEERDHYSLVHVIELPEGAKRFVLVYGPIDSLTDENMINGTGPFATLEDAAKWFYGSGR